MPYPPEVLVSDEVRIARKEICLKCDKLWPPRPHEHEICYECICPVDMLTQLNFKQCPVGKW